MKQQLRNFNPTTPILSAALFLSACAGSRTSPQWTDAASMSTGRSEIHSAALDGTLYVAGGIGKFRILKSCEAFSVSEGTWKTCPDLPRPLHHMAMASDGKHVFAAGGYVSLKFKHLQSPKLWSLRPNGAAWETVADLPGPIGEHVMVWAQDHLFLIGGTTPHGDTGNVWRYLPESQAWTKMEPMPTPRNSMAAVVFDGEIWLLGGRSDALGSKISKVEIYNPAKNEWRSGPDMPLGRGGHSATYLNRQIHVFGGETFDPVKMLDRHDVFDLETYRWAEAEPAPKPRHGTAAIKSGDAIFLIGGGARPGLQTIYSASSKVQVWRKYD